MGNTVEDSISKRRSLQHFTRATAELDSLKGLMKSTSFNLRLKVCLSQSLWHKMEIDVGLITKDGAIGWFKNGAFQAMTNFSIACKGFVSCGSVVEGYLIEVIPATCHYLDRGQGSLERYVMA